MLKNNMVQTDSLIMRPGAGWKQLNRPVWEHINGTRIHVSGHLIRLPNTKQSLAVYRINNGPEVLALLLRINGLNLKRAMMAFACTLLEK